MPTVDNIIAATRKNDAGWLKVGEDILIIEIGNATEVKRMLK